MTTSDKTLLELAAKAAGIEDADYHGPIEGMWSNALDDYWNPLTDDGDALRLAVKLHLDIHVDSNLTEVTYLNQTTEAHLGDPYAATRRAIVRAAAKLG